MTTPDNEQLIGAQEAAKILGVEVQRISRWRKAGRLPEPYVALRLTPVWLRADIERMKETGRANGFAAPPNPKPFMGTAEAAEALGVGRQQISRWRARPLRTGPPFPEPSVVLAAGPLWRREDIADFARKRERWLRDRYPYLEVD